jgi:2-polyprenyl-6-methoxyphenol hydroxylase-like FAD-dependent oxidoreductase
VGINVQPSAVVELAALGLLPRLDATGIRTREVCYFNRHGQKVWSEPRGMAAGYRVPQFSIHRGELQMLLLQATVERLGAQAVRAGCEAVSVDPAAGTVRLRVLDAATGQPIAGADVEIRRLAVACLRELTAAAPAVFADFDITVLADGTEVATSPLATEM